MSAVCREAIRGIGTNAIPILLSTLRAKDSAFTLALMQLANRQDYIQLPIHSVEEQKEKAAIGFQGLGDLATNAVPDLIGIYLHPSLFT